ncbi:MAG: hypothetical protein J6Y42_04795 [Bacilli bacterium]|nr:hypothetical protein [Bacilli bacterium]
MKKFWQLGSRYLAFLVLLTLPMTGLIYSNPISGTTKYFSMFRMIFGYKDYEIKFNIILFLIFLIILLTGFIDLLFKDKVKAYITKMFVYAFDIIMIIFSKFYFLALNKDYIYKSIDDANKSGYALLIISIILAIASYFSYMSFIYEYEDIKNIKNNKHKQTQE